MKPVDPQDVARLAMGDIDDEAEAERILEAISRDEGLLELFDLLSEDVEIDDPSVDTPDVSLFKERLELQRRSQLWSLGKNPFPDLLKSGEPQRVSVSTNQGVTECTAGLAADRSPGRIELKFKVPVGYALLDVVCVNIPFPRFNSAADLEASRNVNHIRKDWNTFQPKLPTLACDPAESGTPATRAADGSLCLEPSRNDFTEVLGTLLDVDLVECKPGEVYIRSLEERQSGEPVPVLLTGVDATGQDHDEVLLLERGQHIYEIFKNSTSDLRKLMTRWLEPAELQLLSARQVSQLLGGTPFCLAATEELEPGRFAFEFLDHTAVQFAADPAVTVCLKVARVGQEVAHG